MENSWRPSTRLFSLFTLSVIAVWFLLLRSTLALRHPDVALFGALFDLLVSVPVLYYFLVVRGGRARAGSALSLVAFCLFVAAHIVPRHGHSMARFLPLLSIPVEIGVIIVLVKRVGAAIRSLPAAEEVDRLELLLASTRSIFGDNIVSAIVASELATLYYGLLSWREKTRSDDPTTITFHQRSGWNSVVAGLILAIVFESTALHLWLQSRWPLMAWIVTALDAYGIVWLLADLRGFSLRTSRLQKLSFRLQFGLRWNAAIDVSDIEQVRAFSGKVPPGALKLTLFSEPTHLLMLKNRRAISGMYGLRKNVGQIAMHVDQPDRLETWARELGVWRDPPKPAIAPAAAPAPEQKLAISRAEWIRRRPDYIPLEDWLRSLPPEGPQK